MDIRRNDRREFLKRTAGVAAAVGWASAGVATMVHAAPAPAQGRPIRLGAPVFKAPRDPEGLALAYRQLGYRAAYCPPVKLEDPERIRDLTAAFAKHDVMIAEVGRWCNLLDADPAKRAANLKTVTDGLALAEAIGARCCVDIAGSFSRQHWAGPHPDNLSPAFFDAAVENARKIIDAVRPKRAKFCYEMMGWALPDSPDSYLKMIKAVDREAFAVHLDPVNIVNCPARYFRTADLLNECFDKLGPWIVSCHAKDVGWDMEKHNILLQEVMPGKGVLDYATYLKRLAALPGDVPLMIEHLRTAEEYDQARAHIMEVGKQTGLRFQ
jgi:sugar phosphate isomerase/epimerase